MDDTLYFNITFGTEEAIRIRRSLCKIHFLTYNSINNRQDYLMGSYGEGFRLPWSDYDVMMSDEKIYVEPDRSYAFGSKVKLFRMQRNSGKGRSRFMLTKDDHCKPGYFRILYPTFDIDVFNPISQRLSADGQLYLCSQKYKNIRYNSGIITSRTQHMNGPCATCVSFVPHDFCSAIPLCLQTTRFFIESFQTKFWTHLKKSLLKLDRSCIHIVPKSPNLEQEDTTQWLLSFAVLEQHIVHSLNYTQFITYGLLKEWVHCFIDSIPELNGLLCSYYLKTVLFHVLEETHRDLWIQNNVWVCFMICVTRLMKFIAIGRCPHYFIEDNNLFDCKLTRKDRKCLLDRIMFLCRQPPYISSFFPHFHLLVETSDSNSDRISRGDLEKMILMFSIFYELVCFKNWSTTYRETIQSLLITAHLTLKRYYSDNVRRICLRYLASIYFQRLGNILYNKYKLTRHFPFLLSAETALQFGRFSDASTGNLYFATLLYCEGKFNEAIDLTSTVIWNFTNNKLLNYYMKPSIMSSISQKPLCHIVKMHISKSLFFDNTSSLIPKELAIVLLTPDESSIEVFEKPYAYLLILLCYFKLKDKNKCRDIYETFIKALFEKSFTCSTAERTIKLKEVAEKTIKMLGNF